MRKVSKKSIERTDDHPLRRMSSKNSVIRDTNESQVKRKISKSSVVSIREIEEESKVMRKISKSSVVSIKEVEEESHNPSRKISTKSFVSGGSKKSKERAPSSDALDRKNDNSEAQ